jgi:hypothetical protein
MRRTILIRLGGLAAMVGGVACSAVFLLGDLLVGFLPLGPTERSIQSGSIQGPILNLLVGRCYGSHSSHSGLAHLATSALYAERSAGFPSGLRWPSDVSAGLCYGVGYVRGDFFLAFTDTLLLVVVGLVLATVGIIALGIMITAAEMLPWWCGVSLVLGSPLLGFVFLVLGLGGFLGVPWAVVGYAIFRAATRQSQQPLRVR